MNATSGEVLTHGADHETCRPLRRSLVARFSVVSLLTMAALAALLGVVLQRRIADRALDSAARTAGVIGEIAVRRYIPRHEFDPGAELRHRATSSTTTCRARSCASSASRRSRSSTAAAS